MDPLPIAFLGCSHSHAAEKVKVVRENPAWRLVGVCDRDAAVESRFAAQGIPVLSRDHLLADRSIAAVAVESAVPHHAEDALAALNAGKHVHLEKPPATTMAEFHRIVGLAERKRLLLQMGYMWRFNPAFSLALDAARQGRLGKVYLIRASMNTLVGPEPRREWAAYRGGQMFEQGCHLIDPMVRLLGAPRSVTPFLRHHGAAPDGLNDNTIAVFEWESALAVMTSSTLQPNAGPHRFFEILGTAGTAVIRPIEPPSLTFDPPLSPGPGAAATSKPQLPPFRRYVGEFAELAHCIPKQAPLSVTSAEDLLVHETVLRASEML